MPAEQYMPALAKANRIRIKRAELKGDVKAGRLACRDVIASPHADLLTMRVLELLLAMPRCGRVRSSVMLRRAGASQSTTLGSLSERQRASLLAGLPR